MTDAQRADFARNGYLVVPDVLSRREVADLNDAVDRDREVSRLWQNRGGGRHQNANLLLTTDAFDGTITHPTVLPLVRALIGPETCFEEFSVMIREPVAADPPEPRWHRDTRHHETHPLALLNLSLVYYLTDVDETTHCFSVVPEPVEAKRAHPDDSVGSRAVDLHGAAGTAILFNAGSVHDARQRITTRERRTIHIYYGHADRPPLSGHTIFPKRLMRGKRASLFARPNEVSRRVHDAFD